MNKTHELKTDPAVFQASWSGAKTFEIRFDDRMYRVGDTVILRETKASGLRMQHGAELEYTGRTITARITYTLMAYGMRPGWMMLQLADQQRSE